MRFLRDSTFIAWTVIAAVLVGLLLFAGNLADGRQIALPPGTTRGSVVSATDSDASDTVAQLRGLAPYGIAAGDDSATLAAWAVEIQEVAENGAAIRAGEGADATDPLAASFTAIAQHAATLASGENDIVGARSLRTGILLGIDRSANIAAGLPVPPTVEGLTGQGTSPGDVTAPELPEVTELAPLPRPLPGKGHGHPGAPTIPTTPSVPPAPAPTLTES